MVIFVGDRPSRLNKSPDVAFIGSKSEKVLDEWIYRLDPRLYLDVHLMNSHTPILVKRAEYYHLLGTPVVALGNVASKRLTKAGVKHFKLPHPSGRNRKLNDPNFIDSELEKCKNYLRRNR